jgi:hypothetical protein
MVHQAVGMTEPMRASIDLPEKGKKQGPVYRIVVDLFFVRYPARGGGGPRPGIRCGGVGLLFLGEESRKKR